MEGNKVSEFYNGRHVFVTGATGFMGKVLLEKLLRSCPGIAKIYVLVRPKKNDDVPTRLQKLLNFKMFDTLRSNDPEALTKIVALKGDMDLPELGLSVSDIQTLMEKVSVVFHLAATVRFDEALNVAVKLNILATCSVVSLCKKMSNLAALVHVSTAYANCDRHEIREEIYPTSMDFRKMLQLSELLDEDTLDLLTPELIGNHPNTYTFTKCMTEQLLLLEKDKIPIAIVRPSIVGAALKEPLPGWIDNYNGPTGLLLGIGTGMLRIIMAENDKVADVIPVDISINLCLVSAWHRTTQPDGKITIFNSTSGMQNPITWGTDIENANEAFANDIFFDEPVRFPYLEFTNNLPYFYTVSIIKHWIPVYCIDLFSRIRFKKPIMVKIMTKMMNMMDTLKYFTCNEWKFHNDNVQKLWQSLTEAEKKMFNFNIEDMDWKSYTLKYVLGIKYHLLKEKPTPFISQAKKKINRLWWISQLISCPVLLILWLVLIRTSDTFRKLNDRAMLLLLSRTLGYSG